MSTVQHLLQLIYGCPAQAKTRLIAIDGRGGSGKSSLALQLQELDNKLKIVQMDSFPCTPEEHPFDETGTQSQVSWKRVLEQVILPLRAGQSAQFVASSWWVGQSIGEARSVEAGGTVIVEGCYALRRELREFYDLKIFVECSAEEGKTRALSRDGSTAALAWDSVYLPNEARYIREHLPREVADIVLFNADERGFLFAADS